MPSPLPYTAVVVDDTPELRSLWRLMLDGDPRFSVLADAADGQSGVSAVRRHRPDLVLLDIAMPVMNGLQALTLIRRASPASAVVMLSSFSRESREAQRAMALGAHGFIRQGLSRAQLLAKLEQIVQGTRPTVGTASAC
jgi:DNA-binding NarL/FixJ family response regulator